jgi:hypothetical protein
VGARQLLLLLLVLVLLQLRVVVLLLHLPDGGFANRAFLGPVSSDHRGREAGNEGDATSWGGAGGGEVGCG